MLRTSLYWLRFYLLGVFHNVTSSKMKMILTYISKCCLKISIFLLTGYTHTFIHKQTYTYYILNMVFTLYTYSCPFYTYIEIGRDHTVFILPRSTVIPDFLEWYKNALNKIFLWKIALCLCESGKNVFPST